VGEKVSEFAPGMRVAAWRDPGNRSMGCYAQYVSLNADDLLEIDQRFQPEEIASLELACVSKVHSTRLLASMRLQVALLPSSVWVLQGWWLCSWPVPTVVRTVVAFDPLPDRRALALSLGADETWDPTSYQWPVVVRGEISLTRPWILQGTCGH